MRRYNLIPVFYYHSVAPFRNKEWYKSFLTFNLSHFEDLLKYLVTRKYKFLNLDEYFYLRTDPSAKGKRMVCLTFDDGYLDNYVYVWPLLKKYNAKGTIFVSPAFVQENQGVRATLEDVWSGRTGEKDLISSGFVSWQEMEIMIRSGVMDIQSHSYTHTMYYSDDIIRDFHNPCSDWLYPIGNLFPERLPYYITDKQFRELIPYGTPFFTQQSSLICKRVFINDDFTGECAELLKGIDWKRYNFQECMDRVSGLYQYYRAGGKLFKSKESHREYLERIRGEIAGSKQLIESKLKKKISHICWPHGDYNDLCHKIAIESGYLSSHIVLKAGETNSFPDRFDRTGSSMIACSRPLSLLKAVYKLESYRQAKPYIWIRKIYELSR